MTRIYTRKGDRGATSLFSGRRTSKCDPRVAAVGELDELSIGLGLARLANPGADELLQSLQRAIYRISAIVSAEGRREQPVFDESETRAVEETIDRLSDALPPLRDFILPGRSEASCRLHAARVVARRAERSVVALSDPPAPEAILAYLNRLSDLLFVLARQADEDLGLGDVRLRTAT